MQCHQVPWAGQHPWTQMHRDPGNTCQAQQHSTAQAQLKRSSNCVQLNSTALHSEAYVLLE